MNHGEIKSFLQERIGVIDTEEFMIWAFGDDSFRIEGENEHIQKWNRLHRGNEFYAKKDKYLRNYLPKMIDIWRKETGNGK